MKMNVDKAVVCRTALDTGDLVTGDSPELDMAWQHSGLYLELDSPLVYGVFV